MGFVIFSILYMIPAVLTIRHRVYWTKIENDGELYYGRRLGPRMYTKSEYHEMYLDNPRGLTKRLYHDGTSGDYRDAIATGMFWWVYWIIVGFRFLGAGGRELMDRTSKKTPGEIKAARKEQDEYIKKLEAENQRLRQWQEEEWDGQFGE
jgi:hypothetical protein